VPRNPAQVDPLTNVEVEAEAEAEVRAVAVVKFKE
jgi:hypothetical protein